MSDGVSFFHRVPSGRPLFTSWRVGVAVAFAIVLALLVTACAGRDNSKITIIIPFDQPGVAIKNPDGTMTGFDVDVAIYVAQELGYKPEDIDWQEAETAERETLLQNDHILVIGTYPITDARKERVDFAGPYFIGGQGLLVRSDDTDITGADSLQSNERLCSVAGSTSAQRIMDEYPAVQLQQHRTYSECVEALRSSAVDAVTAPDLILAGYAAQNLGSFKLVGEPFSEEPYGIGLVKGDTELRDKVDDAIQKMESSGAWKEAFDRNLGSSGFTAPTPPLVDRY